MGVRVQHFKSTSTRASSTTSRIERTGFSRFTAARGALVHARHGKPPIEGFVNASVHGRRSMDTLQWRGGGGQHFDGLEKVLGTTI